MIGPSKVSQMGLPQRLKILITPTLRAHDSRQCLPGEYAFRLQVSDGESWSAYGEVTFQVIDADANGTRRRCGCGLSVSITPDCPLVSGKRHVSHVASH